MRRTSSVFLAAAIVAGCASQKALTPAPPSPSPSPPSAQSLDALANAASPVPTTPPVLSPAPVAAKTFKVRWKADDPTGIKDLFNLIGVARSGDAYVLVGELPYRDEGSTFAAWWSQDGRTWKLAQEFPIGQRILTLTAGGPGFVVGGFGDDAAVVWMSVDGRAWQPVSDASLSHGVINQLVPTASGVVGFGWRSDIEGDRIWTSPDGVEWLAATNETGMKVAHGLQAVGAFDGRAIAIVDQGDGKRPAVWETTGRAEWTRTGTFPNVDGHRTGGRRCSGLGRARFEPGVDIARRPCMEQGRFWPGCGVRRDRR